MMMENIIQDVLLPIMGKLDDYSLSNLVLASKNAQNILSSSPKRLENFTLIIKSTNFDECFTNQHFCAPLKNISISFDRSMNLNIIARFVNRFCETLETLELNHFKFKNFFEIFNILNGISNLKSLRLNDCHILSLNNEKLRPIKTLKSLLFNKCDDNTFKIFTEQEAIEKITVENNDWTWNGFPHEIFNRICENCKSLHHMVLNGAGTGSYFDSDEFPYKVKKLETTMISFHWYVGIRSQRTRFLESQKESLKDLTIHELPYDFDGGRVLKYIIEEMDLDNFYYGDIPLIVEKVKQKVKAFSASEIQITSILEMVKQFICNKIILKLSKTDICSDEIEKNINNLSNEFSNIKEFEVEDNSAYRGTFGVFLGIFTSLPNVEKLEFKTKDRNINTILECLPRMELLEEMHITSTAPRVTERLRAIRKCAPNLKTLSISKNYEDEAEAVFSDVKIIGV